MTASVGPWIQVDPGAVVDRDSPEGVGVVVSPSPFDIPLALRINEGNLKDQAYCVELRYLGGEEEQTKFERVSSLECKVGLKSGRVYAVMVDTSQAQNSKRASLDFVTQALRDVGGRVEGFSGLAKYKLASKAVESRESDLVNQLKLWHSSTQHW
jgi:hypothetical protein